MNRKLLAALLIITLVGSIGIASAYYSYRWGRIRTSDILDNAVTSAKIAPGTIPHAVTKSTAESSVTGTTYDDVISTSITVARESVIIVMYSAESKNEAGNNTIIKCTVGSTTADPNADIILLPGGRTNYESVSFTFYANSIAAGTYDVTISLKSSSTGTVYVQNQALVVFALPA